MQVVSRPKIYYGWWLVLVCLLIQAVSAGTTIYIFSVFAKEYEIAFEAGRATIMLGLTGMYIAVALVAPKLGKLLDRYSIRRVMIGSGIVMGAGFVIMSFSTSVWHIVGGYTVFISAGMATLVMIACPALLSRWFVRYRGLAIGIAALGTQFGGFTFPPTVAFLIDAFDWRFALRSVGIFGAMSITLLVWFLVYDRPEDRGLHADGDAEAPDSKAAATPRRAAPSAATLLDVFKVRNFWLGTFGLALMYAMVNVALANLALFATDIGTPKEKAAFLVSIFALVGMVASPTIGRFTDVADLRLLLGSMLACSVTGLSMYLVANTYTGLAIATAIIAIPGGSLIPITGALAGRLFDLSMYARAFGAITLFTMTFSALAPMLSGWVFDVTGSYRFFFRVFIGLLVVAFVLALMIRKDAHEQDEGASALGATKSV